MVRPLSDPGEAHRRYGRLADVLTIEQLERAERIAGTLPPFTDDEKRALRTLIVNSRTSSPSQQRSSSANQQDLDDAAA